MPGKCTYDLAKAKALVKQLGGVTFTMGSFGPNANLYEALQSERQAAGMHVILSPINPLPALVQDFYIKTWQALFGGCGGIDPAIREGSLSWRCEYINQQAYLAFLYVQPAYKHRHDRSARSRDTLQQPVLSGRGGDPVLAGCLGGLTRACLVSGLERSIRSLRDQTSAPTIGGLAPLPPTGRSLLVSASSFKLISQRWRRCRYRYVAIRTTGGGDSPPALEGTLREG